MDEGVIARFNNKPEKLRRTNSTKIFFNKQRIDDGVSFYKKKILLSKVQESSR